MGIKVHAAFKPVPVVEYVPGPHSPLPLDELHPFKQYAPAGHGAHAAVVPLPAVEKLPAGHRPLPLDTLHPGRQNAPAGHAKQAAADVDPTSVLYVPAGQSVHVVLVPLPAVE